MALAEVGWHGPGASQEARLPWMPQGLHHIEYEDGDSEEEDLTRSRWRLLDPSPRPPPPLPPVPPRSTSPAAELTCLTSPPLPIPPPPPFFPPSPAPPCRNILLHSPAPLPHVRRCRSHLCPDPRPCFASSHLPLPLSILFPEQPWPATFDASRAVRAICLRTRQPTMSSGIARQLPRASSSGLLLPTLLTQSGFERSDGF